MNSGLGLGWAAVLGVLQGLTEFLPVSSSGHLAIAQHFVPGFQQPGLLFDVTLHVGTLASVCAYFWKDLASLLFGRRGNPYSLSRAERARLLFLLGVATGNGQNGAAGGGEEGSEQRSLLELEAGIRRALKKYFQKAIERRPLILPVVIEM